MSAPHLNVAREMAAADLKLEEAGEALEQAHKLVVTAGARESSAALGIRQAKARINEARTEIVHSVIDAVREVQDGATYR